MSTISAGTTSTTTLIHSGDTTGSLVLKTNDTGSGGTTAVTINTSQNVGIGTSSPSEKLHISGEQFPAAKIETNSTSSGDSTFNLIGYRTTDSPVGYLKFWNNATSQTELSRVVSYREGADNTGNLRFYTSSAGSLGERMRIDSSGNVGIGTTNIPSNKDTVTPKLIVNGAGVAGSMQVVRNTTPGVGGAILELTSTRGTDVNSYTILQSGDGVGSVVFGGADGNEFVVAASINAQVDKTPGDNDMPGRLVFSTTADGASTPTERMRIDSSGVLLVGTTSASDITAVNATNLALGGKNLSSSFGASFNSTSATGTQYFWAWGRNGTSCGSITSTATNSTSYNTSSDYRLKENIAPMTGALSKVALLKPVTYTWKSDGSAGQGFIAHELAEVEAGCVTGEKDAVDAEGNPVYQGIDTSFLVATLTAAIKEQQTLIQQLQADVAALKGTS